MNKQQIIENLRQNHKAFANYVLSLNEADYELSVQNKWTAGQQLDHIVRSVWPVTLAFRLPKFAVGWWFGKANRPSKSYDELVAKYLSKLSAGGVATTPFMPKNQAFSNRQALAKKLEKTVEKLCQNVKNCAENELDTYILPHPLLGKLTYREMLYFTMYHVLHHEEITKRNLGQ